MMTTERGARGWGSAGLIAALIAGAFLRLLWLSDIEYKGDEDFSAYYALAREISEPLPAVGMESSTGIPNFGLSVWAFAILGWLSNAKSPPDLAAGVGVCSVVALFLYVPFIRRLVPEREREAWSWGVALMAVSPLAVFLQRKIWPPSLFPILTFVFLAGWLRRERALGAFAFGCAGALLGQLHFSGFFLAAGFVAWALLFDRNSLLWRWWLLGSAVGSAAMLPWIVHIYEAPDLLETKEGASWLRPLKGHFWMRWLAQPFGLDTLSNSLGSNFGEFLRGPVIGGQATFLVGALHAVSAFLFLAAGLAIARRLWRLRRHWPAMFVGRSSATAFTLAAAFWGFGVLFALTGRPFRYYYLLVSMPLMFVAAAHAILGGARKDRATPTVSMLKSLSLAPRHLLLTLCFSQALISLAFRDYVHTYSSRIRGDHGVTYAAQTPPPVVGQLSKHLRTPAQRPAD